MKIKKLQLENFTQTLLEDLYGLDANQVLLKVMDTDIRNDTTITTRIISNKG
jgi:hypothetical protein